MYGKPLHLNRIASPEASMSLARLTPSTSTPEYSMQRVHGLRRHYHDACHIPDSTTQAIYSSSSEFDAELLGAFKDTRR